MPKTSSVIIPSIYTVPDEEPNSRGDLEFIFSILEGMEHLPLTCVAGDLPDTEEEHVGYLLGNGKIGRLTPDQGLVVSPIAADSEDPYDYGFVYSDPASAIGWLLCRMGLGSNGSQYESEALLFQFGEGQRPLRLGFELPLERSDIMAYRRLTSNPEDMLHLTREHRTNLLYTQEPS